MNKIFIVEYWRKVMDGYEYSSNRLFYQYPKARITLVMSGYRVADEEGFTFKKDGMKVTITERVIE